MMEDIGLARIPEPDNYTHLLGKDWQREEFFPRNSIVHHPDGRKEVEPGGWDHEHCEVCRKEISRLGNQTGSDMPMRTTIGCVSSAIKNTS